MKSPLPAFPFSFHSRRPLLILCGVFLCYGTLVGTHRGEFWPFSIYQMFSTAGAPWTRALVVELPREHPASVLSQIVSESQLPGVVLPLDNADIAQNDLSAFLARKDEWTTARKAQLSSLFDSPLAAGKQLLLYRVFGRLAESGDISVAYIPAIYLTPDTLIVISEMDLSGGGGAWQQ